MDEGAVLDRSAPIGFVATTEPRRARAFYESVLGLTFVADDGVALVFDMAGTMLRIAGVDRFTPQPFTVLGWRVDDLGAVVRTLAGRGVRFERYAGLEQDALGVGVLPGGTRVAWFKDPDGNTLSISQFVS